MRTETEYLEKMLKFANPDENPTKIFEFKVAPRQIRKRQSTEAMRKSDEIEKKI